jgi:LDH2 family malate/lactate/ureidoglycolate dehydrogenase
MTDRRVAPSDLQRAAVAVLTAAGADAPSAIGTARALMHASLHGVDSHGIRLLPFYVRCLTQGVTRPHPNITVTRRRPGIALVDADGGLGHQPTYRAVEAACEIAAAHGIGMAAVIRSTHFGAAGAYALAAAEAGFMALVVANSGALVAPFGGRAPVHGTDPIAFAAPAAGGDPFLLDMATSAIPWNRVLLSRALGHRLPVETGLARDGSFTEDAAATSMLAPLGGAGFGYKGAGLAGMVELLSAALTGMRLAFELDGTAMADTQLGHLVIAIDPGAFVPAESAAERVAHYCRHLAGMPGEGRAVHPAGGPQWAMRDERLRLGIPLPPAVWDDLGTTAAALGVAWPP